jgi:hypothetical protein
MGLPRARGSDQEDVRLLDPYILEIGVGHDRVVGNPGIRDSLVVVAHAERKTPRGDLLPDGGLVEMGDNRPRGRNGGEPFLLRGRRRRGGWLGSRLGLRRGLGDHLGGAEAAEIATRRSNALTEVPLRSSMDRFAAERTEPCRTKKPGMVPGLFSKLSSSSVPVVPQEVPSVIS